MVSSNKKKKKKTYIIIKDLFKKETVGFSGRFANAAEPVL